MSVVQFSTHDTPEALRRELVEAVYNGHVRTGLDFLGEGPVEIDVKLRGIAGVHIAFAHTTPVTLVTPPTRRISSISVLPAETACTTPRAKTFSSGRATST